MERFLLSFLRDWKNDTYRKPLVLRGARQVGKSYLVDEFGRNHFDSIATVNLENRKQPFASAFQSHDPQEIISTLQVLLKQAIIPGKTLLFLDEIQECPEALMALRYFKEEYPQQHVIAAGSLLEFSLEQKDFKMPVGRVQYAYLRPLPFFEFLKASNNDFLLEALQQVDLTSPPSEGIHLKALAELKTYLMVGGMPAAVKAFVETQDMLRCIQEQREILDTYQDDFSKYASTAQGKHLRTVFQETPKLLGEWTKYSKIDATVQSKLLKNAIAKLSYAGVLQKIHSSTASGMPMSVHENPSKFKLLFLDVGLALNASAQTEELMALQTVDAIHKGALAEQFVGQELLSLQRAFSKDPLFFWYRPQKSSQAEVDYLFVSGSEIIPLEVKAGKTGRLKSLWLYLKEKKAPLGVHIGSHALQWKPPILSLPLYLVPQLPKLLKQL